MDVRCEICGTEYEFDAARIGPQGVKVKCTACGHIFTVQSKSTSTAKTPGADWLVRTSDDRLISFEKLTTLQKWIIEGRIEREDEISRDRESWKRMGNVQELEPFFSVFDRASALNDLMNTGSIGEHPVLVNGSEVLATTNPLRSSRPSTRPPSNRARTSQRPPSVRPSTRPQSLIKTQPVKPVSRRASSLRSLAPTAPEIETSSGFDYKNDNHDATPDSDITEAISSAPQASYVPQIKSQTDLDTGFAGPAALNDLSIADAEVEGDEVVQRFERKSRLRRRVLGFGSLIIGGLVGGGVFALYGIPQSPLAKIKNSQVKVAAQSTTNLSQSETARSLLEKDSLESIKKSNEAYLLALKAAPEDTELQAERALVLTIWADSLRRHARRDEATLKEYEQKQGEYNAAVAHYQGLPPRAQSRTEKPSAPATLNSSELRTSIEALRTQASSLTREAFGLLEKANAKGVTTIGKLRALADYYRVQRDAKAKDYLDQANAIANAAGQKDPLTMFIRVASVSMDLEKQSFGEREKSIRSLEEILTLRPTLIRARVLLGRLLIAQTSLVLAKQHLERVLKESPNHEEAQEILKSLAKPKPSVSPSPDVINKPKLIAETKNPNASAQKSKPANNLKKKPPSRASSYQYHLKQGRKLRKENLPWKALHAYEKAASIRKSSAAPYIGIGWCYLELGKPIAALNQFKKASLVEPRSAEAQLGLGRALMAQGKIDEALEKFEQVLDTAPKSRSAKQARRTIEEIRASE